jgi:UDP-N-acetylglucosamine--N-acetylmuramyl-(pentapeptide) pyrophosphoryl-undecaprenol N-acetylglucosamine transferase
MTIVLTGGGSGGHITPLLAVADELKSKNPHIRLVYIGQTGDSLGDVPAAHPSIDAVYTVRAGKFRRYHGAGLRQILDIPTLYKNIRDMFFTAIGICQSYWLLKKIKPAAVFVRGGFVGVPVGLAAGWRKIPYITHDSDAIPSLANRIIAKKAAAHAVAMPKETYSYPQDKTFTVGVPITKDYQPVTPALMREYRRGLSIHEDGHVLCVTGGGLGAKRLNMAVATVLPILLQKYPDLVLLHLAGRGNEEELKRHCEQHLDPKHRSQIITRGFVNDLYRYSAAADIIVCRGGATNLAEFALQQKPIIVVPNPMLSGGHQLKNAEVLEKAGAVKVVHEADIDKDPEELSKAIIELFNFAETRQELAKKLAGFARPESASILAELIIKTAGAGDKA